MRTLLCLDCGRIKRPTHPDDAALGLIPRRTYGFLTNRSLVCDQCAKSLNHGDEVIALSSPANMGNWEREYLTAISPSSPHTHSSPPSESA